MRNWAAIVLIWVAVSYLAGAGVNGMCGTWAWYFQLAATLAMMCLTSFIPAAGLAGE